MDYSFLLVSAGSVFIYMVLFYLRAQSIKNNSIVDIGWGPGFFVLSSILLIKNNSYSFVEILLLTIVFSWSLRLALHIFSRNRGKAEDFRYANWRKEWGRKEPWIAFYKVFMLQGFFMLIIGLPIIFFFMNPPESFGFLHYAGLILFLSGFLIETIADAQLLAFKNNKTRKSKIIQNGLWKYSRHPNYFGEALVWWGIFIFCINSGFAYISVLSPLSITLLLRFGSGVPMLEEKYRNDKEFINYAKKTPIFIPFIGKKGM